MIKHLVLLLGLLLSGLTLAENSNDSAPLLKNDGANAYEFESDKQRQMFLRLTAELRCPMCQNQNIADSDAMIAHDMRRKTHQLLQQGYDEAQVIDFMKQRYGDFVHYQPPVTMYTLWLWVIPVVFALLAMMFVMRKPSVQTEEDRDAKLKQADALLKQED